MKYCDVEPGWSFISRGEWYLLVGIFPDADLTEHGRPRLRLLYLITRRDGSVHFWNDMRWPDAEVINSEGVRVMEPET